MQRKRGHGACVLGALAVATQWLGCGGSAPTVGEAQSPPRLSAAAAGDESGSGAPQAKAQPSATEPAEVARRPPEGEELASWASAPVLPHPAPAEPALTPTQRLMHEHFVEADQIRRAVIAGRQEEYVKPAHQLTYGIRAEELPATWREPVERMQDAADRLKGSHDLWLAAAATADIGVACGDCHRVNGGPRTHLEAEPAAGDLTARMKRHGWATERLWEGLFVPSDEAWQAGAAILSQEPFPGELLQRGGVYARSAAEDFAKAVQRAPGQGAATDRAQLYARLLSTCATCHVALEVGRDKRRETLP